MKVKGSLVKEHEIYFIFEEIRRAKEQVFLWQHTAKVRSGKLMHYGLVSTVDKFNKLIFISPLQEKKFKFSKKEDIFIYSKSKDMACRTHIKDIEPELITCTFPVIMNQVTGELMEEINHLEKEEAEKYVNRREYPRIQAKEGTKIKVLYCDSDGLDKCSVYQLNDISEGGLAFIVDDPGEFQVGDILCFQLDKRMLFEAPKGKVVAIRKDTKSEGKFKVCVKFD